jgi:hypothetical protein
MLFAIGAGPRVVAVSSFDREPAEVRTLPNVGALLDPDVEKILSLRPDLVVVYGTQRDLSQQLERAGIARFGYVHGGLSDILKTLTALGAATGDTDGARRVVTSLSASLDAIRAKVGAGAAKNAAGLWSRAWHAAEPVRQRGRRLPARHARRRRRRGRLRRHRSRVGAGDDRAAHRARPRGRHRAACGR